MTTNDREHAGQLHLPHEIVAARFMPTARIMLARELAGLDCSQRQIGSMLGITQAAVSKYLSGQATPESRFVENERMQAVVERTAEGWVADELDAFDAMAELLDLVREFEDRGPICGLHEDAMPVLEGLGCDLCVRGRNDAMSVERGVLRSVRTAARTFAAISDVSTYVPNVGSNVAESLPQPSADADVAAIPGRLHTVHDRIVVPSEPEFGASEHVALALLVANAIDPEIRGAVNLATDPELLDAARDLGIPPVEFDAAYENRTDELRRRFGHDVPPSPTTTGRTASNRSRTSSARRRSTRSTASNS